MPRGKRKAKYTNSDFPDDCAHRSFFGCKSPNECVGCYYNPIREMAFSPRNEEEEEEFSIDPKPDELWFYSDPVHVEECLALLNDIKSGKGLWKNGNRCWFKNARKGKNDDSYEDSADEE